jgi:hypothetical protein
VRWHIPTGEVTIVGADAAGYNPVTVNARGDVVWRTDSATLLTTRDGRTYELPEVPQDLTPFVDSEPVALTDDATLILNGTALWWC